MNKQLKMYSRIVCILLGACVFALSGQLAARAQSAKSAPQDQNPQLIDPGEDASQAETVTINVKDANISEVLKAYSLQTGQSIVVGPDVISDNVNVRLNDVEWQEALDVILKPYGFGYRVVGGTIVVSKLENIVQVEGIEPLVSKVFNLRYLDAYDVREVLEAQLTARGKITILSNKGLPGWEFGGGSSSSRSTGGAVSNIGTSQRKEADPIEKSKTIIVTDVPSAITAIAAILEELDDEPDQVLIEARFVEVGTDALRDFGVDFATGVNGLATPGVQPSNPTENNQWGVEQNDSQGLTPAVFDPVADTLSGTIPYNSGLQLLFSRIAGENFEILVHALEESGDANVLSAPQILTLDNQEAAILVGTKFPIIESDTTGGSGQNANVSTSLDYYENIGIQLNVIPQVSNEEYINMIVHPAVSSIDGFEQGIVASSSSADSTSAGLTRYPVLKVREAQTQIMVKSGDSAVIGGLQSERDRQSEYGIPWLKDIPVLGYLFKRTTTNKEKIELLIFIKASIVDNESHAAESAVLRQEWNDRIDVTEQEPPLLDDRAEDTMEEAMPAETVENVEVAVVEEQDAATADESEGDEILAAEKEEMVSFVSETSEEEEGAAVEPEQM